TRNGNGSATLFDFELAEVPRAKTSACLLANEYVGAVADFEKARLKGDKMSFKRSLLTLALLVACYAIAPAATRTFLSSAGTDTGACPRTAPCAGLAYALTQTDPSGTVIVLDTTAIGGATISQSVTITALPGEQGLIKVQPRPTGITVSGGTVALIGLRIEGFGAGSTTGIAVTNTAARVLVRGCDFTGLSIGINVTGGLIDLINNNIVSNTLGVRAQGPGLDQDFNAPGPGMVQQPTTSLVRLDGGNVARNATAFEMQDPGLAVSTANYRQNGGNNAQNIFLRT